MDKIMKEIMEIVCENYKKGLYDDWSKSKNIGRVSNNGNEIILNDYGKKIYGNTRLIIEHENSNSR
jgi:hypothetical protein